MSQAQRTILLTEEQIETTLKNWFKVLNITKTTTIFKGKPVFSAENEKRWGLPHLTKFADRYVVYECERKDEPNLYFITIETDKFDKIHLQACIWFYHLFQDKVYRTQNTRPEVFICPCFVVMDMMFLHVPINIVPVLYRFVGLADLYPLLGSKTGLFGMSYEYKILSEEELKGSREYSTILDDDVIVRILNAVPGDVIQYKRVLCELGC